MQKAEIPHLLFSVLDYVLQREKAFFNQMFIMCLQSQNTLLISEWLVTHVRPRPAYLSQHVLHHTDHTLEVKV